MENIEELLKTNYGINSFWDSELEEYYYPLMDSIQKIAKTENPKEYFADIVSNGLEINVFCKYSLNSSGGIEYVNLKNLLRIVQSMHSHNAEAIKMYLTEMGYQRIQEIYDPELIIKNVIHTYRTEGLTEDEIIEKLNNIEV